MMPDAWGAARRGDGSGCVSRRRCSSGRAGAKGSGASGGGGSSGAGGGGEVLDYAAFEAAWLDGHCRMAVACETFPDQATCLASLGTTEPLRYATFVDDIAAGRILFDATAAARCLTVHASPSCTQTHAARVSATDLCDGVTTGTVPAGGACFFNEECAGGGLCRSESLPCDPRTYCCFGACQPRTVVPRGGDCSAADAHCVDGTRCTAGATASAPPTCAGPPDTVGSTCYRNPGCAAPLYCDASPDGGAGTCTAPVATGERCNPSSETSLKSCEDLRDNCTGTGTCVGPTARGAACGSGTLCRLVDQCDFATEVCARVPGPEESCKDSCLGALVCDQATHRCLLPTSTSCWSTRS